MALFPFFASFWSINRIFSTKSLAISEIMSKFDTEYKT